MKKAFVCFVLILTLGLLLVGCGRMAAGRVGSSPVPIGGTPALPIPSAEVSMAPIPGETERPRTDSGAGQNAAPAASTAPSPSGTAE